MRELVESDPCEKDKELVASVSSQLSVSCKHTNLFQIRCLISPMETNGRLSSQINSVRNVDKICIVLNWDHFHAILWTLEIIILFFSLLISKGEEFSVTRCFEIFEAQLGKKVAQLGKRVAQWKKLQNIYLHQSNFQIQKHLHKSRLKSSKYLHQSHFQILFIR